MSDAVEVAGPTLTMRHRAAAFIRDGLSVVGFHCDTCGLEEEGFRFLRDADRAVEDHRMDAAAQFGAVQAVAHVVDQFLTCPHDESLIPGCGPCAVRVAVEAFGASVRAGQWTLSPFPLTAT